MTLRHEHLRETVRLRQEHLREAARLGLDLPDDPDARQEETARWREILEPKRVSDQVRRIGWLLLAAAVIVVFFLK